MKSNRNNAFSKKSTRGRGPVGSGQRSILWGTLKWALAIQVIVSITACAGMASSKKPSKNTAKSIYMIGNSFTHNTQPYSIPELASQQSISLTIGAHVRSGSPLHVILGKPAEGREISPTFGKFSTALKDFAWDAITLQPFYKKPSSGLPASSMQTDIDSILAFIAMARQNPANKDTNFYIYTSWPLMWYGKPYQTVWDTVTKDVLTSPSFHTRDYFEHLIVRVRALTDADVYMIPIGDVLYALDTKMKKGDLPGYTGVADILSNDKLHLNEGLGHYVAGTTVYATICRKNPTGLIRPEGHYEGAKEGAFTPAVYKLFHETIWEVVTSSKFSGVSGK